MHYVSEMFDQLTDLVETYTPVDPHPVSFDMKKHYLNMGQYAMWPRVYRIEQFEEPFVDGQNEYPFDADAAAGRLVYVEGKANDADAVYSPLPDDWYHIQPGPNDILRLSGMPTDALIGGTLRSTFTLPLLPIVAVDENAAASEEYSGPDYAIEGPALYAMNRITARGLHARLDYGRQSVDYNNRSAIPNELMASSVFWLDEFERRVDQWQLVHPQSVR